MPQGSVLGPILFTMYTTSLGNLFRAYNMNYQLYPDDSQTYVIFKPTEHAAAVHRMDTCLATVRKWVCRTYLKLNDKKTDMLPISTKQQIEVFKILNGYENIDSNIFFEIKESKITRGHNYTLVKKQSRLDVRKYSFSQRTINVWNKLSTDCVHASSVNMFKNKIDKYLAKAGYT